jgi:hypothetical protein
VRDRDRIFGHEFVEQVKANGSIGLPGSRSASGLFIVSLRVFSRGNVRLRYALASPLNDSDHAADPS